MIWGWALGCNLEKLLKGAQKTIKLNWTWQSISTLQNTWHIYMWAVCNSCYIWLCGCEYLWNWNKQNCAVDGIFSDILLSTSFSLLPSFRKCLLSGYCAPSTVLGVQNTGMCRTELYWWKTQEDCLRTQEHHDYVWIISVTQRNFHIRKSTNVTVLILCYIFNLTEAG